MVRIKAIPVSPRLQPMWMIGRVLVRNAFVIGAGKESAFKPMIDELESRLAPDASMLVLVGETPAIDAFVSATATGSTGETLRSPLTSDQAAELNKAVPTPA